MRKLVFDLGVGDGSDTSYYLSEGFRVLAVEANSALIDRARKLFDAEIISGRLVLVNAAVCEPPREEVTLHVTELDLGSSTIFKEMMSFPTPLSSHLVRGVTIGELIDIYGMPYFMKVDIQGAERFCVLPLRSDYRPEYISFEAGNDLGELVQHLEGIGFQKFKAINQRNFMELKNQGKFSYQASMGLIQLVGYKEPKYVRVKGRFFQLCHSSGPAPWSSDGRWYAGNELLERWHVAKSTNRLGGWYDVHAK